MRGGKPCPYYSKGFCKFGQNCRNYHPQGQPQNFHMSDTDAKMSTGPNQNSVSCKYFSMGKCTNKSCPYFHGYGNVLQQVYSEQGSETNITNMAMISNSKFITSSETSYKIWTIQPEFQVLQEQKIEGKITKLIYSNGKIIFSTLQETMLSTSSQINVANDQGSIFAKSSMEQVLDLLEEQGYIFACGKGMIEIFQIVNSGLVKCSDVKSAPDDYISTITCVQGVFFCGHGNGAMTMWKPKVEATVPTLVCEQSAKISDTKINKIFIKTVNETTHYLISCSSQIQIYNIEKNYDNIFTHNYGGAVLDLFFTKDFEGNERYFLSIDNGTIKVCNNEFNEIFDIPTRIGYCGLRFAGNASNPFKDQNMGEFIVSTDGTNISIFMWIKEGSFVVNKPHGHAGGAHRGRGGHPRGRGGYQQNY